jgi:hypothetical protein
MLCGCNDSDSINGPLDGSGKIITQVRNVSECNSINLRYAGSVYLTQDNNQSIRVEADDNIIDYVITQAENGVLTVGLQNGSYSHVTVRIYISLKSITGISINGAGNIIVQNQISSDDITCFINGAGDINLKGYGNNLDCRINGAGNIEAFEFQVKNCTARINGTGNCSVNTTEMLDAAISGVGNITYDGNPKTVKSSISGIGKISRK